MDQRRHICEWHGSERLYPGLARSAAVASVWEATGHSFPGAPLCISRSRGGLSSSESTKHHEALRHILAGDVKAFGSPTRRQAAVGRGGLATARPPQRGLGSGHRQDGCCDAGEVPPAAPAGMRVRGRADTQIGLIGSAQIPEKGMSKCHTPWLSVAGGGSHRTLAGASLLGYLCPPPSSHPEPPALPQPLLGSLERSTAPSRCQGPGLCLVLRALGPAGEEKGKGLYQETRVGELGGLGGQRRAAGAREPDGEGVGRQRGRERLFVWGSWAARAWARCVKVTAFGVWWWVASQWPKKGWVAKLGALGAGCCVAPGSSVLCRMLVLALGLEQGGFFSPWSVVQVLVMSISSCS